MTTKELAMKLGLVRKRKQNPRAVITNGHAQVYSYLVVLDFESTCWEVDCGLFRGQEIIEFPAVLFNVSTGEIADEFQQYVTPVENPNLSEFCKKFTAITQEDVDNGVSLPTCLNLFSQWLRKNSNSKGINFNGTGVGSNLATMVTWTDWDLGTCLAQECHRKQLGVPTVLKNWIDLKAIYKKFYARTPKGLSGALKEVGLSFEGREHSGLHDARNTAALAWKMICDGCVLKNVQI